MGDDYAWILSQAGTLAVLFAWAVIAIAVFALGEKIAAIVMGKTRSVPKHTEDTTERERRRKNTQHRASTVAPNRDVRAATRTAVGIR